MFDDAILLWNESNETMPRTRVKWNSAQTQNIRSLAVTLSWQQHKHCLQKFNKKFYWLISWICLFVCSLVFAPYRSQFKSNLHQTLHTGRQQSVEWLITFSRSWGQRSRSRREVSASPRSVIDLVVIITLGLYRWLEQRPDSETVNVMTSWLSSVTSSHQFIL